MNTLRTSAEDLGTLAENEPPTFDEAKLRRRLIDNRMTANEPERGCLAVEDPVVVACWFRYFLSEFFTARHRVEGSASGTRFAFRSTTVSVMICFVSLWIWKCVFLGCEESVLTQKVRWKVLMSD